MLWQTPLNKLFSFSPSTFQLLLRRTTLCNNCDLYMAFIMKSDIFPHLPTVTSLRVSVVAWGMEDTDLPFKIAQHSKIDGLEAGGGRGQEVCRPEVRHVVGSKGIDSTPPLPLHTVPQLYLGCDIEREPLSDICCCVSLFNFSPRKSKDLLVLLLLSTHFHWNCCLLSNLLSSKESWNFLSDPVA